MNRKQKASYLLVTLVIIYYLYNYMCKAGSTL